MVKVLVAFSAGGSEIREIDDDLETLQKIVEGYISEVHWDGGLAIVNEDADGLERNELASEMIGTDYYGNVVFCGGANEEGDMIDYQGPQGGGTGPI